MRSRSRSNEIDEELLQERRKTATDTKNQGRTTSYKSSAVQEAKGWGGERKPRFRDSSPERQKVIVEQQTVQSLQFDKEAQIKREAELQRLKEKYGDASAK